MYGRGLGLVTTLALGLCPALAEARAARPDPLAHQAGCERYRGTPQDANDTSQLLELRLCTAADGSVRGILQTSSLVSGWSTRASAGGWQGDTLILRESEFLQYKPEPDWRFCLIDEMKLQRTPEGALQGTYVSQACQDDASFVLERVAETNSGAVETDSGAVTPAEVPARAPDRSQTPEREPAASAPAPEPTSSCACTSAHTPARRGAAVLLLLLAWFRRPRRSAGIRAR